MPHKKIYIIAGEPSGDALGGRLIHALRVYNPAIKLRGIGGEKMANAGIASLFPIQDISIMGFAEILPHARKISQHIKHTIEDIETYKPDIVVTIDSPGFCKRVVSKLRQRGKLKATHFIHYVAPTVWAYKPERAAIFASLFDHILLLLPFEPPYFEKAGLPSTFVGHSLLEENLQGDSQDFREKHRIPHDATVLCLLAGSRRGEIRTLLPIFLKTIQQLRDSIPNLHIVLPTITSLKPLIEKLLSNVTVPYIITDQQSEKYAAYAATDLALCKSGTVSLELAMATIPMVIAYKVHPLSAWMLRRMIKIPYVNLINILQKKSVIPECLQENCTAEILSRELLALHTDTEKRNRQIQQLEMAINHLTPEGGEKPSHLAAKLILSYLK